MIPRPRNAPCLSEQGPPCLRFEGVTQFTFRSLTP